MLQLIYIFVVRNQLEGIEITFEERTVSGKNVASALSTISETTKTGGLKRTVINSLKFYYRLFLPDWWLYIVLHPQFSSCQLPPLF